MWKTRLISLLTAAVLAVGLAGCTPSGVDVTPEATPSPTPAAVEETAQPFTLPRTEGVLHPILSTDKVNLTFSSLLWEGLFELDRSFEPHNVLCQSYYVSEDGLSWTFTLHPGVTFSDGSALTAADVAASLELARTAPSRFAGRLSGVQSVRAEEGGVTVTLSAPNGALPALLDIPVVKAGGGDVPLGTGPYALSQGEEGHLLAARADWWQNKPLPADTIPLQTIQEADDLIYAFDTGSVSLVTADLTGTGGLGFAGDHEVWDYPTTAMVYVGYRCTGGPCADPVVRRALDRALDRATVAMALYARHAQEAALPVPPDSPLYDQALADRRVYAPQAAADLLTEGGWEKNAEGIWAKDRTTLKLTFVVNTDQAFRLSAAEYLAQTLTSLGIEVDFQRLAWSDYQQALAGGKFDLYLGSAALSADLNPAPLLTSGGALNFGGYQSAAVSELLRTYQAATGESRGTASKALWAALETEVPFSTLCFKNQSVLTRWGVVEGLEPTQQNPFYGIEEWKLKG